MHQSNNANHLFCSLVKPVVLFFLLVCWGCNDIQQKETPKKSTIVSPSINYKGQFKKASVRKSVSTYPNAIKNKNRSRYYYQTRGKYRTKK